MIGVDGDRGDPVPSAPRGAARVRAAVVGDDGRPEGRGHRPRRAAGEPRADRRALGPRPGRRRAVVAAAVPRHGAHRHDDQRRLPGRHAVPLAHRELPAQPGPVQKRNLYVSDTKLAGCKSSCESLQSLAVFQSYIERIRVLLYSEIDGELLEGEPAETVQAMPGVLRQNKDSQAEDSDAFVEDDKTTWKTHRMLFTMHTGIMLMKTSS